MICNKTLFYTPTNYPSVRAELYLYKPSATKHQIENFKHFLFIGFFAWADGRCLAFHSIMLSKI